MTNIELLGRCLECVVGKRSAKYCRVEKSHTQPKVSSCLKCYNEGYSTSKCRQELGHSNPNGTIAVPVYGSSSDEGILSLPRSCQEFSSWSITVPVNSDVIKYDDVKYATGYLLEYSAEKFELWYEKYCKQSSTRYSICTGKL